MAEFKDRYEELKNGRYKERIEEKLKNGYFDSVTYIDSDKVTEILNKKKFSDLDMATLIGTTKQSTLNWKSGTLPRTDSLYEIAKLYSLPVDWLLGLTNVDKIELQNSYAPFSEMGFSYEAYQNLLQLKESGKDMSTFMQGINHILEFKYYSPITKKDLYVIIDALNNFFSLYPSGTGATISNEHLNMFMEEIRQSNGITLTEESVSSFLLSRLINQKASTLDNSAIASLNDYLKKCKGKIVAAKIAEYEQNTPSLPDAPYDEHISALYELNLYYSPESTESIFTTFEKYYPIFHDTLENEE